MENDYTNKRKIAERIFKHLKIQANEVIIISMIHNLNVWETQGVCNFSQADEICIMLDVPLRGNRYAIKSIIEGKVRCNSVGKCEECINCGASEYHYTESCEPCPFVDNAKCE